MEIEIKENQFVLLPQKAIVWKNEKTLLISDLHLGKVTHFRKEGIAIPSTAFENNFTRLDEIILSNTINQIIFLGDLFHNSHNAEWNLFTKWRNKYNFIEMIIVLGNHDILSPQLFKDNNIKVFENDYIIGSFVFSHHPIEKSLKNHYHFCGHIHPEFYLKAKAKQRLKLPCFVVEKHQAILPSFGIFTGGYEMKQLPGRQIFVVADNEIYLAK